MLKDILPSSDYIIDGTKELEEIGTVSIIEEKELVYVKSGHAGFFDPLVDSGQKVRKGQLLARILDPGEGRVLDELCSPVDGTVFYVQSNSLSYAHAALVKLLKA